MSRVKEPGYYSNELMYARGHRHYLKTYFPDVTYERWVGEATPWYLYSAQARERIASQASGESLFIVCLRDPADRAISMYNDQVHAAYEQRPATVALSPTTTEPSRLEQQYVSCGYYYQHLVPWFSEFGSDRFLVLLEEELKREEVLLGRIAEFLGCARPSVKASSRHVNASSGVRSMLISRGLRRLDEGGLRWKATVRRAVPETMIRRAGEAIVRWNHAGDSGVHSIEGEIVSGLREHFNDSVTDLSGYLERDLLHWPSHPRFSGV